MLFLDMDKYQDAAMRTRSAQAEEGDAALLNAALGIAGEGGEIAEMMKKHLFHGHDLDKDKVRKEIGDVLWYCALGAYALGTSLGAIAEANIRKLERRYPDGFEAERSKNKDETQEG